MTQELITEATTRATGATPNQDYGTNADLLFSLVNEHAAAQQTEQGLMNMINASRPTTMTDTHLAAENAVHALAQELAATQKALRTAAQGIATLELITQEKATYSEPLSEQDALAVAFLDDLGAYLSL